MKITVFFKTRQLGVHVDDIVPMAKRVNALKEIFPELNSMTCKIDLLVNIAIFQSCLFARIILLLLFFIRSPFSMKYTGVSAVEQWRILAPNEYLVQLDLIGKENNENKISSEIQDQIMSGNETKTCLSLIFLAQN